MKKLYKKILFLFLLCLLICSLHYGVKILNKHYFNEMEGFNSGCCCCNNCGKGRKGEDDNRKKDREGRGGYVLVPK